MYTNKTWDLNLPRWIAPFIISSVGFVAFLIGIGAIWIASGGSNPPVGERVTWNDHDWVTVLAANATTWAESPMRLPDDFTIDVTGQISADSDPSAAWGVWVETPDGSIILYAISGEGYTTTRVCPDLSVLLEDCPPLVPGWRWIAYNRLREPGHDNKITLHRETPSDIRLRLNNELWGIAPVAVSGRWGVWARGGRESEARFKWR